MRFGFVPPPVPEPHRTAADRLLRAHFPEAIDDAWRLIEDKRAQLWMAGLGSALVSRRWDDELEIWLMAGSRDATRWLPTIEAAARDGGVRAMSLIGRRGWARLLRDWRTVRPIGDKLLMKKDLDHGR